MDTEASIKHFLNSLSQLPGSLLYRDSINWRALPPGDAGHVLALDSDLRPEWIAQTLGAPALMGYDGSGGYYYKTGLTWLNNNINFVCRFRVAELGFDRPLFHCWHASQYLFQIHITAAGKLLVHAWNSAAALCLRLQSVAAFNLTSLYTMTLSYNKTAGTVAWIVNGSSVDDLAYGSRICNAATLPALGSCGYRLGFWQTSTRRWKGSIGFIGFKQPGAINYSDFFQANNLPQTIDQVGWTQWGGQPFLWHESGAANQNFGSSLGWLTSGFPTITPFNTWT